MHNPVRLPQETGDKTSSLVSKPQLGNIPSVDKKPSTLPFVQQIAAFSEIGLARL
jgi:hypothetical protein